MIRYLKILSNGECSDLKEFSNITSNGPNFNMITHFLGDGESYEHMRVNLHFSAKMCLPADYFLPTFSDPARSTKWSLPQASFDDNTNENIRWLLELLVFISDEWKKREKVIRLMSKGCQGKTKCADWKTKFDVKGYFCAESMANEIKLFGRDKRYVCVE